MKLGGAEAVLPAVPTTVTAATMDSYELHYYMAGASQPFQLFALPSGSYQCNQLPNPNTSVANPTMAEWNDPDASGRVCRYVEVPGGLLFSFPAGTYEATIRGFNSYGVSPESNRAVFGHHPQLCALLNSIRPSGLTRLHADQQRLTRAADLRTGVMLTARRS